jgi:tRNA (guanine37-N1)-methyltransferase
MKKFLLTGGELPAMMLVDAISRMVPGVLSPGSADEETFMQKDETGKYLKEYPQYTRPLEYNGWKVPEILASGNHGEIKKWRESQR